MSPWRSEADAPSLPEVFGSISAPSVGPIWRRMLAYAGPGYLIAVGYMDPGNWATDLAGGSAFGYALLSVVLLSSLMAMLLQALAVRLGVVTGRDLAQACRDHYGRLPRLGLWLACEIAIVACDLAEVIGTALALQLLFHLPLVWGVALTASDVMLILLLQNRGFRLLEAFVIIVMLTIALCFGVEIALARPALTAVLAGLAPSGRIVTDPAMLYLAVGIIGATVMPHSLYLHSSIVQTRRFAQDRVGRRQALRFATLDSTVALLIALAINAAILILAAAVFHAHGLIKVAEIQDAYKLLAPTLGVPIASALFAIALLGSGQNSAITATLAGQIVMEGFLKIRAPPWLRRLVTRGLAIIPAAFVAARWGDAGVSKLLVGSQVALSLQLPFAMIPLIQFTSDRTKMGEFVNPRWLKAAALLAAGLILTMNAKLILNAFGL